MNEYKFTIIMGLVYTLLTGIAEFVFKTPLNAFGMFLGMVFIGVFAWLFEKLAQNK